MLQRQHAAQSEHVDLPFCPSQCSQHTCMKMTMSSATVPSEPSSHGADPSSSAAEYERSRMPAQGCTKTKFPGGSHQQQTIARPAQLLVQLRR